MRSDRDDCLVVKRRDAEASDLSDGELEAHNHGSGWLWLRLENGFAVAQEYIDVETAKQTGRAAFGEMVAYLKAHPSVRVMLVEKTDRLYRNLKDWVRRSG